MGYLSTSLLFISIYSKYISERFITINIFDKTKTKTLTQLKINVFEINNQCDIRKLKNF